MKPNYGPGDIVVVTDCMSTFTPEHLPRGAKYIVQEIVDFEPGSICHACGKRSHIGVNVFNGKAAPHGYLHCKFRLFDPREDADDNLAIVRKALSDLRSVVRLS